jgi:drug/metabolite transporter (DMT)-like permease
VNHTLIATITGLFTAVAWGAGDWLTPRSKRQLSAWQINFAVNFVGALVMAVVLAVSSPHVPAAGQLLRIIGGSALICGGYVLFVRALTIGAVGIVVPLGSVYPMVTLVLSVIFLHQVFSTVQVLAIIIIMLGAVLLAYENKARGTALRAARLATLLTLAAVPLWGTGFFVLNPLVGHVAWQVMVGVLEFTGVVLAAVYLLVIYRNRVIGAVKETLANRIAVSAGLILTSGTIVLYLGAGRVGNIIVPIVISSLSPLISAGLGAVVDQERLGVIKRLGALIAVGGIVVLNLA